MKKKCYKTYMMTAALTVCISIAITGCGGKDTDTQSDKTISSMIEPIPEAERGESKELEQSEVDLAELVIGSWSLDYDMTEKNLQNYGSMQELFGTGLQQGNGLNFYKDDTMDFYIGIGVGGEGVYDVVDNEGIIASITAYVGDGAQEEIGINPVTVDNVQYLTMTVYEETMYFLKNAEDEK